MSAITPFHFGKSPVRIVQHQGDPWFVAADVCAILEISNRRDAVGRLDEDEKDGVGITDAIGREQQTTIISESGLYALVFTSRKAEARCFRKWVTGEVLPSIRKTGSYGAPTFQVPQTLSEALLLAAEQAERIEALEPKAAALDRLSGSDGSLCITDAAKAVGARPKDLFRWLRANGWIYRRAGASYDVAYQNRIAQGVLEHKTTTVERSDGSERIVEQVRVTPKGVAALASVFGGGLL